MALLTFSLLPTAAISLSSYFLSKELVENQSLREFSKQLSMQEKFLEIQVAQVESFSQYLSDDPLIRAHLSGLNQTQGGLGLGDDQLDVLLRRSNQIFQSADFSWKKNGDIFMLTNLDGVLIYSAREPTSFGVDLSQAEIYQTSVHSGFWGGILGSSKSNDPLIKLLIPTLDPKEKFLVIAKTLSVGGIKTGMLIYGKKLDSDDSTSFLSFDEVGNKLPDSKVQKSQNNAVLSLSSVLKISQNPTHVVPGAMVYNRNLSQELNAVLYKLTTTLAAIFAGCALLIIVFSQKLAFTLTAPIRTIQSALERFSAGSLEVKVKIYSRDEFGNLAKAFNAMIEGFKLSKIDPLSGLFNRRHFNQIAENIFSRARRKDAGVFCLAIFDLDHFKKVNDTYGHLTGDKVLKEFSDLLSSQVRPTDIVSRFGGEEFVVLMPDHQSSDAFVMCKRVAEVLGNHKFFAENGTKFFVTTSVGIASFQEEDQSISMILERADKNLYLAKKSGRNQIIS